MVQHTTKHLSRNLMEQVRDALDDPKHCSIVIKADEVFEEDIVKKRLAKQVQDKIALENIKVSKFKWESLEVSLEDFVIALEEILNSRIKDADTLGINVGGTMARMFHGEPNDLVDSMRDVTSVKCVCIYNGLAKERLKKFICLPCVSDFTYPIVVLAKKSGDEILLGTKNVNNQLLVQSADEVTCCAVIDIICSKSTSET